MYGYEILRVPTSLPPPIGNECPSEEYSIDSLLSCAKFHVECFSPAAVPEGSLCCLSF